MMPLDMINKRVVSVVYDDVYNGECSQATITFNDGSSLQVHPHIKVDTERRVAVSRLSVEYQGST